MKVGEFTELLGAAREEEMDVEDVWVIEEGGNEHQFIHAVGAVEHLDLRCVVCSSEVCFRCCKC